MSEFTPEAVAAVLIPFLTAIALRTSWSKSTRSAVAAVVAVVVAVAVQLVKVGSGLTELDAPGIFAVVVATVTASQGVFLLLRSSLLDSLEAVTSPKLQVEKDATAHPQETLI